jgi:hypothetical protein
LLSFDLSEHPYDSTTRIRPQRQEVDDVGPAPASIAAVNV